MTATLAHQKVDFTIQSDKPSRGSMTRLMAVAAKPAGHRNIGQVSPTRKRQRLPEEIEEGHQHRSRQQDRDRLAGCDSRAMPVSVTPDSTTGSSAEADETELKSDEFADGAERQRMGRDRAHELEAERRPVVLCIPDQHRQKHDRPQSAPPATARG